MRRRECILWACPAFPRRRDHLSGSSLSTRVSWAPAGTGCLGAGKPETGTQVDLVKAGVGPAAEALPPGQTPKIQF